MAYYDLKDVRAAAAKLDITYKGRRVRNDVLNLGYSLKDVAACLQNLIPSEFSKTHHYKNSPHPYDEYICKHCAKRDEDGDDIIDEIYVKFCLIDGCLMIELASFHPPKF